MSSNNFISYNGEIDVYFNCPNKNCNEIIDCTIYDPLNNPDGTPNQHTLAQSKTLVKCSECNTLYTIITVSTKTGKSVRVDGYPDTHIDQHDLSFLEDYEYYIDEYEPNDPHGVFQAAIMDLDKIRLESTIDYRTKNAFYRMLYLQYFIAVEAYLSDRLIKFLSDNHHKILPLILTEPFKDTISYKLKDIAKEPNFVFKKVKEQLQKMSFHELTNIADFYNAVLGVKMIVDDEHRKEINQIIMNRHDLVHRNGYNSDGERIYIGDAHFVTIEHSLLTIVDTIEDAYLEYTREPAAS